MSEHEHPSDDRDAAVEALLRQAAPRPAPPAQAEAMVRDAVHAEWQSVVRARRWRKRSAGLAMAASLVLAIAASFSGWLPTTNSGALVASIDKHVGTVFVLEGSAEKRPLEPSSSLRSGQIVETGKDSALGLAWGGGGSLRMDSETRLEFVDEENVFLHRGRVYFDSSAAAVDPALTLNTSQGSVTHLGTQYMASRSNDELIVSVREGQVQVDGRFYTETADSGRQLRLQGSARPTLVSLSGHSDEWAWTERVSPVFDIGNRSARDFLLWVGRETGFRVVFESPEAEDIASTTNLIGQVDAAPREELRLRMLTTDISYVIDAQTGTLNVHITNSSQR